MGLFYRLSLGQATGLLMPLVFCACMRFGCAIQNQSQLQALKDSLLVTYDKYLPPVVPGGLQIEFEFVLRQFVDISTTFETIEIQGWWRLWWDDPRLMWDAEEWELAQLTLSADLVWLPDITSYEYIEEEKSDYGVILSPSGRITYSTPRTTKLGCPMDIKAFPYDRQKCNFTVGSWSLNGAQMDVAPRFIAREPDDVMPNRSVVDLSIYQKFQEWALVATRAIWKNNYYTCCPEPYPVIIVELEIHRATRTYFSGMVAPIVLVTVISFMALLMPSPTSGARPALSVTMMLTIATVYFVASRSTPQSNDSTLIGRLYLAGMLCSFVLVFVSILTTALNLIHSDDSLSRKRLAELFQCFDKDKDGLITEDEIEVVLRVLNLSPEEKREVLDSLPNRTITEEQWLSIGDLAKKHDDLATFHNRLVQAVVRWAMSRRIQHRVPDSEFWHTFKRTRSHQEAHGPDCDQDAEENDDGEEAASVAPSQRTSSLPSDDASPSEVSAAVAVDTVLVDTVRFDSAEAGNNARGPGASPVRGAGAGGAGGGDDGADEIEAAVDEEGGSAEGVAAMVAKRKGAMRNESGAGLLHRSLSSRSLNALVNNKRSGVRILADKLAAFSFVQSNVQRTGRQLSARLDSWVLCLMPPCFCLYLVLEVVGLWAERPIDPREWGFSPDAGRSELILQEMFDYRTREPAVLCHSFHTQPNLYQAAFDKARTDCGWNDKRR